MLKARLPTQRELTDLYKEVELLRKDKKLKDDTIKFLQKEKETIQRELKQYEQLCEGVTTDVSSHRELEAETKQLQADILHLKDVIRRQNALLRNAGTSGNKTLDRQFLVRMCGNLQELLSDVKTPMSNQVYMELENQKESLESVAAKRADTTWHLLEIIDRVVLELKAVQKKTSDLPGLGSSLKKYATGSNLLTTNSASVANLSSVGPSYRGKRPSGRSRLERSQSAPALNGIVPHPPTAPPPSAIKNIYKNDRSINSNTHSMLDALKT